MDGRHGVVERWAHAQLNHKGHEDASWAGSWWVCWAQSAWRAAPLLGEGRRWGRFWEGRWPHADKVQLEAHGKGSVQDKLVAGRRHAAALCGVVAQPAEAKGKAQHVRKRRQKGSPKMCTRHPAQWPGEKLKLFLPHGCGLAVLRLVKGEAATAAHGCPQLGRELANFTRGSLP
jgi:hypothetical protein